MAPAHVDPNKIAAFDLETTGTDPLTARVVTASLVHFDRGVEADTCDWLADPGIDIPDAATRVHGITTEHARKNGQPHGIVVEELITALREAWEAGYTVVAYNAPYDLGVLHSQGSNFTISGPVLDPLVVDRARDRFRKGKRTLTLVAEHYKVPLANAHDAHSDARAAGLIARRMLTETYPDLTSMTVDDLMAAQTNWHRTHQTGLREFLQKKGSDVSNFKITAWPLPTL